MPRGVNVVELRSATEELGQIYREWKSSRASGDAPALPDDSPPPLPVGPSAGQLFAGVPHRVKPTAVGIAPHVARSFAMIPWVRSWGIYPQLYGLSRMLQPRRILEIGTFMGYGLITVLRATKAKRVVAVDNESYFGRDYLTKAEENIRSALPKGCQFSLFRWDTAAGLPPALGRFDFVMVDGDHSRRGARRDCQLAWEHLDTGGWLFIDDVHSMPSVREGVRDFVRHAKIGAQMELFTRTTDRPRGAYVLQKA